MIRLTAILVLMFGLIAPSVAVQAQTASPEPDVPHQLITQTFHSDAKVRIGPDGYPYLIALREPDALRAGKTYALPALAALAMHAHSGIAVFEHKMTEPHPVWVFSLGAMVLLAHSAWVPAAGRGTFTIQPTDRVNIGTPSTAYLPVDVRKAIRAFVSYDAHIKTPKIAMIVVQSASGEPRLPYAMSVNIPASAFKSQQQWQNELHKIEWFIPPNIDFVQPPREPAIFAQWFNPIDPV